ncbi:hypothetical protein [Haploplasma axanthum]|uniref:Uncharacterized protein n=1 Tax=Haploplasma axanthum TaxID=29552 RepID=A0A449BDD9_HAPAX|nr:hypothetical protein [Haploplasma axanthum]VEU80442.1 Uncharacterised protein [Haploplasma axanthum]
MGIKLGGYSRTRSITVSESNNTSYTYITSPDSPRGYYGFYAIAPRKKYRVEHKYSDSNYSYDKVFNIFENVFMFDTDKPKVIFIYSGGAPLI